MKRRGKKEKASLSGKNDENGVEEKPLVNSEDEEDAEKDNYEPEEKKKKPEKKKVSSSSKKSKQKEKEEVKDENDESEEKQYEVEQILDEKMIRGVRHFLIRWKGYEPESDTWEPESTLNCEELIRKFKESKDESNSGKDDSPKKESKKGKKDKQNFQKQNKKTSDKKAAKSEDWDENEDFEVDRILEVHNKRGGGREFLVSWKGYPPSDNSWEPEENLDCPDLIAKFMAKVEKAREAETKELRVHRVQTERYTLQTPDSGRRLSRRNMGKQRVHYHDAE